MRNLLLVGTVLMAAGCTQQAPGPVHVTWAYGSGAGDGVAYDGPKPIYSRAYGAGVGDGVTSGQTAVEHYAYGADGQSGTMIETDTAKPVTRTASPAPSSTAAPNAAPGTHS